MTHFYFHSAPHVLHRILNRSLHLCTSMKTMLLIAPEFDQLLEMYIFILCLHSVCVADHFVHEFPHVVLRVKCAQRDP